LRGKRQREREEWRAAKPAILLYCRVKWGRVFNPWAPLPLAIGVREAIAEAASDRFAAHQVGWFLRWWCHRPAYREAIARGGQRYLLAGSPAGEITEEQRAAARQQLKARQESETMSEAAD
jgi:sRNA-binding protein